MPPGGGGDGGDVGPGVLNGEGLELPPEVLPPPASAWSQFRALIDPPRGEDGNPIYTLATVVGKCSIVSLVMLGVVALFSSFLVAMRIRKTYKSSVILILVPGVYLAAVVLISVTAGPILGMLLYFLHASVSLLRGVYLGYVYLALWCAAFYGVSYILSFTKVL